ncbi:outer membrane lipid asymmetry maintenance protein MlaD [Thalassotalea euphylliae]|uniref:outer membrane lipid asymmetry maintenance protein MlaD n=1 Tax=Thalassotalea euphylliae TaxID=1655234 RepID=UPI00363CDD24
MSNVKMNLIAGIFVVLGLGVLFFMSVSIGGSQLSGEGYYSVIAKFDNSSGLKEGAFVEVSGVRVGQVGDIELDTERFEAVVEIILPHRVQIPDDSVASIRTSGIIGDRFIKLSIGGSDLNLEDGEEIIETESSINLEELVSKYMFSEE